MSIAFIDLAAQQARIRSKIDTAIAAVLDSGAYIMGPQVKTFERQLGEFAGASHVVSCGNGTDALVLPLKAWNVGPGDAVFCPSFTFAATAEIVPWTGATPVFVEIDPVTYNMDPARLRAAVEAIKAEGKLTPRVVIAVDLFGQPADYPAIAEVAREHGMKLIADSAQGFGCTLNGHHPIHWADAATTSFFPAKPLGCYGDGGAVLTNDAETAELMDSFRVHGKAVARDVVGRTFDHDPKYLNMRIGMNSRLDTVQAAILIEKLAIFSEEIEMRNAVARRYNEGLAGHVAATPQVIEGGVSIWAQYTLEHDDRDGLAAHLKAAGVPSAVYYPVPMHKQTCYSGYPTPGGLAISEEKAGRVISLPMHPYLTTETQDRIIEAVRAFGR